MNRRSAVVLALRRVRKSNRRSTHSRFLRMCGAPTAPPSLPAHGENCFFLTSASIESLSYPRDQPPSPYHNKQSELVRRIRGESWRAAHFSSIVRKSGCPISRVLCEKWDERQMATEWAGTPLPAFFERWDAGQLTSEFWSRFTRLLASRHQAR